MILILSECEDDKTDEVCAVLNEYNTVFLRINSESRDYNIDIFLGNGNISPRITIGTNTYCFSDFTTVWFRRGRFIPLKPNLEITRFSPTEANKEVLDVIQKYVFREFTAISDYIYSFLRNNATCFNYPPLYNINKLIALDAASRVGFNVPKTVITKSSDSFSSYMDSNSTGKFITKSISDWYCDTIDNYALNLGVKEISHTDIGDKFNYSLLQHQIKKTFEVRTFVWDNKSYSAAIYSPPESTAQIDFRNDYDGIRITPYQLPKKVEAKLMILMKQLDLESGSVDFIVDKELNYYFLEVNPVGQFDFIDKHCNYNLAEIIAKTLIKNESDRR